MRQRGGSQVRPRNKDKISLRKPVGPQRFRGGGVRPALARNKTYESGNLD